MVHVSFDEVERFVPRVPKQICPDEDNTTPRICVAPNILSAIQAMPQGGTVAYNMARVGVPVSTLWVDMLKESMIRSLYRDSDKLIQTEDEQYISRLRSQIDKARTERDRESKKYLRLWKTVRKEFGDEKAWELIEKAEE